MPDVVDVGDAEVPLIFDGEPSSSKTVVCLAHGAGAGSRSDFMSFFAQGLAGAGLFVARFDFVYMTQGRKVPDRQPILEKTYGAVVEHLQASFPEHHLVIGGKSLGGRIASHTAIAFDVAGVVFLGYPLHPPGRPDRIRDAHLHDVRAPMLFVEGTRDPFCPLETLARVRRALPNSTLAVIEDGDHSFKVRKSSGRSSRDAWAEALDAVAGWVRSVAS